MWRRLSLTETGGLRPGRRHRPPWERLGISGPLFVIFIIVTGVSMGTFTWLIQQLAHPHTNITSPNITSHATVRTNTHTLRKRHVFNSDQNCTTNQIRSTTLCISINTTTTVTVPWGMLESTGQNENRKLWQVQYHWYMTLRGLDKWSWKNLVAETGPDWSSYSTGRNVLLWRRGLTLAKEQNGLKLIIPPGQREGCQYFILAPYMDTGPYSRNRPPFYIYYFKWNLIVCFVSTPDPSTSTIKDDRKNIVKPTGRGRWGPITMVTTPPTLDDAILTATGVSGLSNNWLLLTEEAARVTHQSCVVCMGARPLLRIIPAAITPECFLSVMKHDNPSANCTLWDVIHPLVTKVTKKPIFSYQVARANFTCVNLTKGLPLLGLMSGGWWCGGVRLFDGLPGNATGTCALVSLLLPISVYPTGVQELVTH
ncbi:unnamed protein product, partial [Coregonus sp. 'balchen']